ncbi:DUF2732 family protein [Pantoea dispersa]|uniref:DUF2732 family protein n=1 Tax=Pantoea dispersa TaxID=59814 RepID=UPI001CA75F6C|nr:DUF2732 family protein [Pantoea dispersa]QZY96534.1 DUF2732 domain-containing protein [Pantoea dispersa]
MLNNSSQSKHTASYIDLDMMLNDARKEERRERADLMVNRLNMLPRKSTTTNYPRLKPLNCCIRKSKKS